MTFKRLSHWSPQMCIIKIEAMVTQTHKALKTVNKLEQLIYVDSMLQHAVSCLPDNYRDQLIGLQLTNLELPIESQKPSFYVFMPYPRSLPRMPPTRNQ